MESIFVFGSNLAGRHGKGAALYAKKYKGAVYGRSTGLMGRSYGIPTKDANLRTLPLDWIERYVRDFIEFAREHTEMTFEVTAIGCGLAGYTPTDIAHFFRGSPPNVILPESFKPIAGA
jgi:hypothetical protein